MNKEKIVGYLLLVFGIGIISGSSFLIYQVFSGQKMPPRVFSFEVPGISLPAQQSFEFQLPEGMELPEGMSLPVASKTDSKEKGVEIRLLPDEVINRVINMSTYLLLMGFLVSVGTKIAGIGVNLVRDIKVTVRGDGNL